MIGNIKNIKLKISYDGTNFYGWQKQPNKITIQKEIEKSLYGLFGCEIQLIGSGRTDSGVHALEQTANFYVETKIKPEKIKFALNSRLPQEIRINESIKVNNKFHSRYDAIYKTYRYQIYNNKTNNPFFRKYSYFAPYELDIEEMKKASKLLLGKHDFRAFKSANSSTKTTERTIYDFQVYKNENLIITEITGDGFLYNMVRIIVGTLMEIGTYKKSANCIKEAFETGNRKLLGHTAKPYGLFLKKVYY